MSPNASSSRVGSPPQRMGSSTQRVGSPTQLRSTLSSNINPGSVRAALSFVKRVGVVRKAQPTAAQQLTDDGSTVSSSDTAVNLTNQLALPIVTETEVIEPMAPGSTFGSVAHDDALDMLLMPPPLEGSGVAEYVAKAENWMMTGQMLAGHEELVSRGLLMIRNVVRSEPRYAAQASGSWLPLVRDSLVSKHGLIRAAGASALAAFAASTPGREASHKDSQVLPRLMQMLMNGLASGGDNNDTQYACLALSNMALNTSYRQPLIRYGVLPRTADVLRAAIRYVQSLIQQSGGNAGGVVGLRGSKSFKVSGKSGLGNCNTGGFGAAKSSSLLKSATYMVALLTSWAVEPHGRKQMRQYDVPRLVSELHECSVSALGDDFPLSRRLALLADTSSAAELLEEIAEVGTDSALMHWEAGIQEERGGEAGGGGTGGAQGQSGGQANLHGQQLRGVSFMEVASRGGGANARVNLAMNSLYRLMDSEAPSPADTSSGSAASPRAGMARAISKKQMGAAFTRANATTSTPDAAPSSPMAGCAPSPATTTTTTTAITSTGSVPHSPGLPSPRDPASGGGPTTPRGNKLFNARVPQASLTPSISAPPLGIRQSSAGQYFLTFSQRQPGFSETGLHGAAGGIGSSLATEARPPSPPPPQQQQAQGQSPGNGSMSGVYFSASVFMEAAVATAPGRGGSGDDETQRRSAQSSTSLPSSKSLRLPAVGSGRLSESTGRMSDLQSPRAPEHFPIGGGRLDLPFHLVRPIPTISASSGKVSRITAAYGQVANPRQPSNSGGGHPLHTHPRAYASEL